ncbi:hypothetical protein cyc_03820 [Cyclospora cayetanensis]|uniref:Uncharacterized protein n=1 Tax=Cyclospora cayetanensis TaxID=88456 RepID=A0A1D3D0K4_9EIME|nr:hypothetical protein cyc_03820 [Cyclospora cayetanensis]
MQRPTHVSILQHSSGGKASGQRVAQAGATSRTKRQGAGGGATRKTNEAAAFAGRGALKGSQKYYPLEKRGGRCTRLGGSQCLAKILCSDTPAPEASLTPSDEQQQGMRCGFKVVRCTTHSREDLKKAQMLAGMTWRLWLASARSSAESSKMRPKPRELCAEAWMRLHRCTSFYHLKKLRILRARRLQICGKKRLRKVPHESPRVGPPPVDPGGPPGGPQRFAACVETPRLSRLATPCLCVCIHGSQSSWPRVQEFLFLVERMHLKTVTFRVDTPPARCVATGEAPEWVQQTFLLGYACTSNLKLRSIDRETPSKSLLDAEKARGHGFKFASKAIF